VRGVAVVGVLACCAVATCLALHNLGTKPLWIDEVATVSAARRSFPDMIRTLLRIDGQHGLYDLFLHVWLRFGRTEAWVRGLSAFFGVCAVGAAGWCAGRWRGPVAAVSASILLAFNSFWLYYAQEARTYTLALFLAVLSTAALGSALRQPSRSRIFCYGAITTLSLYANLFAVLFVASQALAVAAVRRHRWRALLPAWLGTALATAPLALYVSVYESDQVSWIQRPAFSDLLHAVSRYGEHKAGLVVLLALCTVALVARTSRRDGDLTCPLAVSATLPFAALWLISLIHPVFVDRYLISSLSSIVILAAAGIAELWDRGLAGAGVGMIAAGALALLGIVHDRELYRQPFKIIDARSAAGYISANHQDGDVIVYTHSGDRLAVDFYLPSPGERGRPADIGRMPDDTEHSRYLIFPAEIAHSAFNDRLASATRVWVVDREVGGQSVRHPDLLTRLRESYRRLGIPLEFGEINVALWSPSK